MASVSEDSNSTGRPLRVLAVTAAWPTPSRPDYGTFVESQMKSMADAGISVRVHVIDAQRTRLAYLRGAVSMLRMNASKGEYDLVHAHAGHCGVLALLQRRYPVLISYFGYDLLGPSGADHGSRLRRRVETFLFRNASRLAAATITKSREMETRLPAAVRDRNHVLPNGVDHARFRPMPRNSSRASLGWPRDELSVLWVGNADSPRKRLDLARAAMEQVHRHLPRARLRVCARVPYEEVPTWMNAADVLLLTSAAEGSPNVVKEAMACNLPVISTHVGDVAEIVADTPHCRVTEDGATPLASALEDVLSHAPVRTDGRERTADLEVSVIAGRLRSIYREAATRRAPMSQRPSGDESDHSGGEPL